MKSVAFAALIAAASAQTLDLNNHPRVFLIVWIRATLVDDCRSNVIPYTNLSLSLYQVLSGHQKRW